MQMSGQIHTLGTLPTTIKTPLPRIEEELVPQLILTFREENISCLRRELNIDPSILQPES
jgi:hypothetical protein